MCFDKKEKASMSQAAKKFGSVTLRKQQTPNLAYNLSFKQDMETTDH